jgi:GNAT superfamily N-acetyltransferase
MARSTRRDALEVVLPGSIVDAFRPDDLAELVVLQRCCWVEEAVGNQTLDVPALHETHAEVLEWATFWATLVVRLDGRLVAAVRGRQEGSSWQVGRLMVAPDLTGRGVGSRLLAEIERLASDDVTDFKLFTGGKSQRNIRTYQRAGYQLSDSPEEHVPGHINGAVYMTKHRELAPRE